MHGLGYNLWALRVPLQILSPNDAYYCMIIPIVGRDLVQKLNELQFQA